MSTIQTFNHASENVVDTFLDAKGQCFALVYDMLDDTLHIYRGSLRIAHTHNNHEAIRHIFAELKREAEEQAAPLG